MAVIQTPLAFVLKDSHLICAIAEIMNEQDITLLEDGELDGLVHNTIISRLIQYGAKGLTEWTDEMMEVSIDTYFVAKGFILGKGLNPEDYIEYLFKHF